MVQWPRRVWWFIALLFVIGVVIVGWALLARPAHLVPDSEGDRWAAEAAILALGAFLLAVLATWLALIAYINSTEKPKLSIDEASAIDSPSLAYGSTRLDDVVELQVKGLDKFGFPAVGQHVVGSWRLDIVLNNSGMIAARFIAVRVTLRGAYLQRYIGTPRAPQANDFPSWTANAPEQTNFWWEGGANAIIHPNWPYTIPTLGDDETRLVYLDLSERDDSSGQAQWDRFDHQAELLIEVIADDHPRVRKRVIMRFDLPTTPPTSP